MTPQRLSLIILLAGLAVIGGAFYFQEVVGLDPCELCLKERVPWYAAIVGAGLWGALRHGDWIDRSLDQAFVIGFALLFVASAMIAGYHVAVEQHWVAGPDSCTARKFAAMSLDDLAKALLTTPPIRCDVVRWSFVGISLAGWNAVLSTVMVAFCLNSLRRRRGTRRFG